MRYRACMFSRAGVRCPYCFHFSTREGQPLFRVEVDRSKDELLQIAERTRTRPEPRARRPWLSAMRALHPSFEPVAPCARVVLALSGLVAFLAAQGPEPSAPPQPPPGTQGTEVVELAHLVDLCAERLRIEVRYEPGQLTGTVALRLTDDISDSELWTLANRALVSRGLATIQMPGEETITVVKLDEAGSLARLEEKADLPAARAGYAK